MGIFSKFSKKNLFKHKIRFLYENPQLLVDIEFANRTDNKKKVWIEPTCIEFESQTEYKICTSDKYFRIEFDKDDFIVFYLQYSFGFKLYKRPTSKEIINPNEWTLDQDTSEIN